MKINMYTCSVLTLFSLCTISANAQLGGLKDKAQKKVEQKADQKAKEVEQKVENKVDNPSSGSTSKPATTTSTPASTGTTKPATTTSTSTPAKAEKATMSAERAAQLQEENKKYKRPRYYTPGVATDGYNSDACVPDDGIVSPMHKANLERIVFSKSKINPEGDNSQLTTTFRTGDNIYMEAFLMTAVKNYITYVPNDPKAEARSYNYIGEGRIHITFDEREYILDEMRWQDPPEVSQTHFSYMITGTGPDAEKVDQDITTCFKYLHKGEHKIKIAFYPQQKKGDVYYSPDSPGAVGEFTFIQTEDGDIFKPADGYSYTKDEGIKTDLHKAKVGKVAFSKTYIDPVTGTASQIDSVFLLTDKIYARAFMSTCMANYMCFRGDGINPDKNDEGSFSVAVMIDDSLQQYVLMRDALSGDFLGKTTFNVNVISDGERAPMNSSYFISYLNNLPDGIHTVKLMVYGGNGFTMKTRDPVAVGSFKINKTPGSRAKLGRTFADVKAKMVNASLETQSVAKLNEKAKAEGWKETFTKAKITEDDWIIVRNEYTGVILGRQLEITALAKWPDGHCTIQAFSMWQDYNGSSYQNSMSVSGVGSQDDLDCN